MKRRFLSACIFTALCGCGVAQAQTDTLRVMAYNVLNYGQYPLCQGPNSTYHGYLKTIVQYANPDILGLEKMGSIKFSPTDHSYSAEIDFQDSIIKYALNAAYPGRYTYCPFTNNAGNNDFSVLFFDQQKLGFSAITCSYSNTEDFNTYKLYYKDPNLAATHDTTFLYVTLNHTISGSSSSADRGSQILGEMTQIRSKFAHLANMINMGDFNVRSSYEPLYQILTAPADTGFRYYDPPFYPDATFAYPADWDSDPSVFTSVLTTSTRALGNVPNTCGTNGGGKNWYDHIFLSPWIVNRANYIGYIPHSFRVIGNDGHRLGISVNDAPANTSAPGAVIEALFQMSNKYPVMADLVVMPNTTGISPGDPEGHPAAVAQAYPASGLISMVNPARETCVFYCDASLSGKLVDITCSDMSGRVALHTAAIAGTQLQVPCTLQPGTYMVRVTTGGQTLLSALLTHY